VLPAHPPGHGQVDFGEVTDTLSAHKVAGVRQGLESAGMDLLYRHACSPDLDPVVQVFAKRSPAKCSNYLQTGYVTP